MLLKPDHEADFPSLRRPNRISTASSTSASPSGDRGPRPLMTLTFSSYASSHQFRPLCGGSRFRRSPLPLPLGLRRSPLPLPRRPPLSPHPLPRRHLPHRRRPLLPRRSPLRFLVDLSSRIQRRAQQRHRPSSVSPSAAALPLPLPLPIHPAFLMCCSL